MRARERRLAMATTTTGQVICAPAAVRAGPRDGACTLNPSIRFCPNSTTECFTYTHLHTSNERFAISLFAHVFSGLHC